MKSCSALLVSYNDSIAINVISRYSKVAIGYIMRPLAAFLSGKL